MAKCDSCESDIPQGKAQCTSCGKWHQLDEGGNAATVGSSSDESVTLDAVVSNDLDRVSTGPWDFCFGCNDPTNPVYGIVRGSTTLLGGSPGAGKSTLSLQIAASVAKLNSKARSEVLYIASEEQLKQIKQRADRLKLKHQDLIRMVPAMTGAVDLEVLLKKYKPPLMILDSLKGMVGEDDGMAIKVCKVFKEYCVLYNCPGIVLTHVTKADMIAGKLTIQHEVDTCMTFFPDPELIDEAGEAIRVLEVQKNRNGPAFVKLHFYMTQTGLEPAEIDDEPEDDVRA